MRCVPGALRQVADDLSGLHAVRYVAAGTGHFDVICEAIFLSQAEMLRFLESELPQVGGIVAIETIDRARDLQARLRVGSTGGGRSAASPARARRRRRVRVSGAAILESAVVAFHDREGVVSNE